MKRITASRIKKILYGATLSDGHITKGGRFDIYNKNLAYIEYLKKIIGEITGINSTINEKIDRRFDTPAVGYRLFTTQHEYFKKMRNIFYENSGEGRKHLTKYIVDRLDFEALAHVWMCDGYMYHAKNRRKQKIQNMGIFCLESFKRNELTIFLHRLEQLNISSRFDKVEWGHGYRPKISGKNLQRFVSGVFPYILPVYKYKTLLYYKTEKYVLTDLPSAEHFIIQYDRIEDIVRHHQQ